MLRHCVRRFFPKFLFSRVLEIAVFWKLGLEQVFRAFSELVPTRENSFRLMLPLSLLSSSTTSLFILPFNSSFPFYSSLFYLLFIFSLSPLSTILTFYSFSHKHFATCILLLAAVNYINILRVCFSYESLFGSFLLVTFWQKKPFRTKKACVKCWWNWHRHSMQTQFYEPNKHIQRKG